MMADMLSSEEEDQYGGQQQINTDESVYLGTEGLVKKLDDVK